MTIRRTLVPGALLLLPSLATAQEVLIEEIVVTATKRAENLQDIPISITAFTGEQIEAAGVRDIRDIAGQTPGLQIKSRGETEGSVFIRGIGSAAPGISADPAVGIYIDGLYASRATHATAAFFDVERVEVVKGPQGTLFGRNAAAGAISIITRRPEIAQSYGRVLAAVGNEGQQIVEFVYNAAIGDTSALRFGIRHDRRDGLYKNIVNGKELNGREHTNVRFAYHHDGGGAYRTFLSAEAIDMSNTAAFVGPGDSFADTVALNDAPADQALESLRINWTNEWDFSDALSLTSITGYYDHDVNITPVDADLTEVFIVDFQEPQTYDFISQEFRLNGSTEVVDWFVGASYMREELSFASQVRYDEPVVAALFGLNDLDLGNGDACDGGIDFDGTGDVEVPPCATPAIETPSGSGVNDSIAIYADLTWRLSNQFDVAVGLRYTRDQKDLVYENPPTGALLGALDAQIFGPITPGPVTSSVEFTSTDPRVALNWRPNDGLLVYVSAAQGYKSGGLNRQFDPVEQAILPFDKETNTAWEIGFKATLMGGRGRLNAALYTSEYENFQLERLINLVPQVENIGNIDVSGAEADFRFLLTDAFEIIASLSVLDSELKESVDPALVGNRSPMAAETSGAVGAKYTTIAGSGDIELSATYMFTDAFFFDIENSLEQPSFGTLDARAAWANETWGIALVGENLTDEQYLAESFRFLDVTNIRGWGRLVRLEARLKF